MQQPPARHVLAAAFASALAVTSLSPSASGAVYITGSVSSSTNNVGLQAISDQGGSASVAVDLGRYIRIGVTHKQDFQVAKGLITTDDSLSTCDADHLDNCSEYSSRTHNISNSLDLTLILYEGDTIAPFLLGGGVMKSYEFVTRKGDTETKDKAKVGPIPNYGGGLAIRLNKSFSLKFTYTMSQGAIMDPTGLTRPVWDRDTSLGLQYQL
jgi:hypothetical protein